MTLNTNNAGPFGIELRSDLGAGETQQYRFSELEAGPGGKKGWLQLMYGDRPGLDWLRVSNSSQYDLMVAPSGGAPARVESATSVTFDGSFTGFTLLNKSGNPIPASEVTVNVGNGERSQGGRFDPRSLIPGWVSE